MLLLPGAVIGLIGFLGHHDAAQIFTQIGGLPVFVVNAVEVQRQRLLAMFGIFGIRNVASLEHLVQNDITAFTTTFGFPHGIEIGGILTHANQGGSLRDG